MRSTEEGRRPETRIYPSHQSSRYQTLPVRLRFLQGGSGDKLSYRVGLHLTQRPPTLCLKNGMGPSAVIHNTAGTYIRLDLLSKRKRTRVDQSTRVVLRLQLIYVIENCPCRGGEIVGMVAKIFRARETLPPLMPLI